MSKGSRTYQEILRNKKGIKHSKTTGPALEFIEFMKNKPKDFEHRGANYVSIIKNGFLVRYSKWSASQRLYDVTNSDGVLMYIHEKFLKDCPVPPKCGTFGNDAVYKDLIKVHLREKKFLRILEEFGYEDDED
jgi:hypothetical protein